MSDIAPITSPLLAAIPGVKHGFFTRNGGVSTGLYDSLNVGRGSKDEAQDVIENRRRAAAWFGVEPGSSAHLLPDPLPHGDHRRRAVGR